MNNYFCTELWGKTHISIWQAKYDEQLRLREQGRVKINSYAKSKILTKGSKYHGQDRE